ncbi:MAG: division/cell wall cluster transcriptional repressor MraZ [Candidatus Binatia bacterium]
MFLGRYFHSLDAKGRVAIPHKFRSQLGGANDGKVIITLSLSERFSYLDVYPLRQWETTLEEILATEIAGEDPAAVRDALLGNYIHPAQEQDLDSQGRILVAAEHREAAGLVKEVVFTGDLRRFRLWSLDEWKRYDDDAANNKGKIKGLTKVWI